MNTQQSLKAKLSRQFHPYQHPQLSPVFAAIVGFVLDEYIVSPRMADLTVTPDGFLLARAEPYAGRVRQNPGCRPDAVVEIRKVRACRLWRCFSN